MSEHLLYTDNATVLAEASGRALGSVVSKYKSFQFMGFNTFTKLYESCVCPVMDYGSSIWGFENYSKPDTVQHRAARIFLGVHRFTPIPALEGDLGWLSPRYRRWLNVIRLWNRLVGLDQTRLTYHAFMQDYYMAQSNIKNWCCNVWQVLHNLKYEDSFHRRTPWDIEICREQLFSLQQEKWQLDLINKCPGTATQSSLKKV